MSRNSKLSPAREPLHYASLSAETHTGGVFSFLNPTHAHYRHPDASNSHTTNNTDFSSDKYDSLDKDKDASTANIHSGIGYKWTSRNNRKGRHALTLTASAEADPATATPRRSSHPAEIARGIWRMMVTYPFYDVSFDVAYIFTWGSIVWVINAFFALLPFVAPSLTFAGETLDGGGITAFIGATIFEVGSVLLMFEAVNESRSACFGWAVERLWEGDAKTRIAPSTTCTHHHQNKGNLVGRASDEAQAAIADEKKGERDGTPPGERSWVWWPSSEELRTHYLHDLGFLACSAQMFGATVFWISGFTALPGIYNHLSSQRLLNGVYWVPQVIGGSGFIVSGKLFMIETQKTWYQPAPRVLGWWVGLFNLLGGIGFTLCPCYGFITATWGQELAAIMTFWGSWAFLIGSVLQWYESLDKYPVERAD